MTSPPDAPWIVDKDTHPGGGPFELEERTTFRVVERTTGRVVLTATGEYAASYDGAGWGDGTGQGVRAVELDGDVAVLVGYDGGTRRIVLTASEPDLSRRSR